MTDIVDPATRSRMMSGIKSQNTKPEIIIRSIIHRHGFRFRLHAKELPGTPDIVLPKYRSVIFVHGCFWHKHNCNLFKMPKTREYFWREKFERNIAHDTRSRNSLVASGWRVCILWECAIRGNKKNISHVAEKIENWLRNGDKTLGIER